jgi:hypothetical protein
LMLDKHFTTSLQVAAASTVTTETPRNEKEKTDRIAKRRHKSKPPSTLIYHQVTTDNIQKQLDNLCTASSIGSHFLALLL